MSTPALFNPQADPTDPAFLSDLVAGGVRLTPEQAMRLYHEMPIQELGRWADARCRFVHGDHIRTYVIDRNINYTNVCTAKCTFCAFRRDGDEHDAYTLSYDALLQKVQELVDIGGTQILMQGGMNPDLPLNWYLDLLQQIKTSFPKVHVHAFSPPEFIEFISFFDPPGSTLEDKLRWVMTQLKAAGLDSVPGGGGEIFADAVRRKIGLGKCDAEAWLTTMRVAHELGMNTSATMMFGHIEGIADRIHHMELVRTWQDRSIADFAKDGGGRYKAFISWPFQRENTPLGRCKEWGQGEGDWCHDSPNRDSRLGDWCHDSPNRDSRLGDWYHDSPNRDSRLGESRYLNRDSRLGESRYLNPDSRLGESRYLGPFPGDVVAKLDGSGVKTDHPEFGRRVRLAGASAYLRTQALSRLYLDNIYSIGASWVTMGPHVGQVALGYGANDMGSVMMEENVVSSAGTTYCLDEAKLCRLIRDAGFLPAQRNNEYNLLKVHSGPDSPDLRIADWSITRSKRLHVQGSQASERPVELTTEGAKG